MYFWPAGLEKTLPTHKAAHAACANVARDAVQRCPRPHLCGGLPSQSCIPETSIREPALTAACPASDGRLSARGSCTAILEQCFLSHAPPYGRDARSSALIRSPGLPTLRHVRATCSQIRRHPAGATCLFRRDLRSPASLPAPPPACDGRCARLRPRNAVRPCVLGRTALHIATCLFVVLQKLRGHRSFSSFFIDFAEKTELAADPIQPNRGPLALPQSNSSLPKRPPKANNKWSYLLSASGQVHLSDGAPPPACQPCRIVLYCAR